VAEVRQNIHAYDIKSKITQNYEKFIILNIVFLDAHEKRKNSIGNSFGSTITQSWSKCMLMNFSRFRSHFISACASLQCVESECCCRKKDVIDHGITDFSHTRERELKGKKEVGMNEEEKRIFI
jgi:hypothetical protein